MGLLPLCNNSKIAQWRIIEIKSKLQQSLAIEDSWIKITNNKLTTMMKIERGRWNNWAGTLKLAEDRLHAFGIEWFWLIGWCLFLRPWSVFILFWYVSCCLTKEDSLISLLIIDSIDCSIVPCLMQYVLWLSFLAAITSMTCLFCKYIPFGVPGPWQSSIYPYFLLCIAANSFLFWCLQLDCVLHLRDCKNTL